MSTPTELLTIICQAIADKKGFNIVAIDVRGVSSLTEYFVIAEGSVNRHVLAEANHVMEQLKKWSIRPAHMEGLQEGDWVVLDYIDVIVHFFIPSLRSYYALEEIWKEGAIVDVPISYQAV